MTTGFKFAAGLRFGPIANRPAATEPGLYPGFVYIADDTGEVAQVVIDVPGTRSWRVLYGEPQLDTILYAAPDGTGADTNSGADAANPVTFAEAMRRMGRGWRRYGAIYLAAGSYALPGTATSEHVVPVPGGTGIGALPLQIIGAWADSGLGAQTETAGSTNTGVLTVAGAPYVANAYRGWRVRFTGGTSTPAQQQASYLIASNTTNTIQLTRSFALTVNAGDTFVIERPDSRIDTGSVATIVPGSGSVLLLRGCELQVGLLTVRGCTISMEGTHVSLRGGSTSLNFSMRAAAYSSTLVLGCFDARTNGSPAAALNLRDDMGAFFDGTGATSASFNVFDNSGSSMRLSVFLDCRTSMSSGDIQEVGTYRYGDSGVLVRNSTCVFDGCTIDGCDPDTTYGAAVSVVDGSTFRIASACTIQNTTAATAPGDAVLIDNGSVGRFNAASGAGNAGVGVRLRNGGRLTSSGAVSVTGAGGECLVGSFAAASTWAAVNTVNGVHDFNEPNAQGCRGSL